MSWGTAQGVKDAKSALRKLFRDESGRGDPLDLLYGSGFAGRGSQYKGRWRRGVFLVEALKSSADGVPYSGGRYYTLIVEAKWPKGKGRWKSPYTDFYPITTGGDQFDKGEFKAEVRFLAQDLRKALASILGQRTFYGWNLRSLPLSDSVDTAAKRKRIANAMVKVKV